MTESPSTQEAAGERWWKMGDRHVVKRGGLGEAFTALTRYEADRALDYLNDLETRLARAVEALEKWSKEVCVYCADNIEFVSDILHRCTVSETCEGHDCFCPPYVHQALRSLSAESTASRDTGTEEEEANG